MYARDQMKNNRLNVQRRRRKGVTKRNVPSGEGGSAVDQKTPGQRSPRPHGDLGAKTSQMPVNGGLAPLAGVWARRPPAFHAKTTGAGQPPWRCATGTGCPRR